MQVPFKPEAVLDELATPIVCLDSQCRIVWMSPACATWLGYSARRFAEQPIASLCPEGPDFGVWLGRASQGQPPLKIHRVRLAPAPDRERFADLTITARSEGWLLEFNPVQEFPGGDPATSVPLALHEALKGLAHEIRNPLAGLRGAAQLLARRFADADADAQRYLDVITAEADRLSALVERLMNPAPPRPHQRVNVHEVLERVRVLAESDAGWSVVIQRDYDPSLPEVSGDPDRLVQAVWNLVRNALEAGATQIKLRTRAEPNVLIGEEPLKLALRIEVGDDGRGVPESLAARIFLPLVSSRPDGSGLGLTLAQQVAREHGGSLSYRSRPAHTVFALLLPVPEDGHDA
jgi:two-component system nitrogen regulation sensor histidine kinase GlnL